MYAMLHYYTSEEYNYKTTDRTNDIYILEVTLERDINRLIGNIACFFQ